MSRLAISARSLRIGVILSSLTAMIAFGVMSIVHLDTLERQIRQAARMSTTDAWAIYQTRLEIQRFELALFRHMSGSDPDRASLDLRFDLLFSRLEVMKTGEDRERYLSALHLQPGDPDANSVMAQVNALLTNMENALLEVDAILMAHPDLPSVPEAADRILVLLNPLSESLSDLAAQATKWFNDASTKLIDEVTQREGTEALVLVGLVLAALVAASALAMESLVARRAERDARAASGRFRDFADAASDWLWETDAEGQLVWCSERFRGQLDQLGVPPACASTSVRTDEVWRPWRATLEKRLAFKDVICRGRRLDGTEAVLRIAGTPSLDACGNFLGFRGVGSDISEAYLSHARIRFLANHDPLTALPNRRMAHDGLTRAAAHSDHFAWLAVDLDNFKNVNDSHGHEVADRVLVEASRRLVQCVGDAAAVARLGGDEFSVLLEGQGGTAERADAKAREIIRALSRPYRIGDVLVVASASVGLAAAPEDGRDVASILKAADVAIYEAKKLGYASLQRFKPWMSERLARRHAIGVALRRALLEGGLYLYYQPQIDLCSGRVVGFEALLRWVHPELGPIDPSEFIPVAEETGLIVELGHWTIQRACRDASAWTGDIAAATVGINLSPAQFSDPDLESKITAAMARSGLPSERIELEVTEGALICNVEAAFMLLRRLSDVGIRIAVDDFGTGYSSLSYLKRFPLDRVKIDRSFIRDLDKAGKDQAIVAAIVSLAHALSMEAIAEGVETMAQQQFLAAIGCDHAQGYRYGRPMPQCDVLGQWCGEQANTTWMNGPAAGQELAELSA
jgi:diguanylate cyclase (GGDEF)-like protein